MKRNRGRGPKRSRARRPFASRGRWLFSAALGLLLAAVGVWMWRSAARSNGSDAPSAPHAIYFPPPPIAPSAFRNTGPDAQYVGTRRCVECHADEHASYLHTAHSRSLSAVDPRSQPPDGAFHHAASGRRYRAYRRDGQLRHRESLLVAGDGDLELSDYPLKYLIGSGRFARTYLIEDEGFLVESPLTWYASLQAWRMSPGYDKPAHKSFRRTVNSDCLFCHAGAVELQENNDERVRLGETAIGCERCHGPGSLHVARWTSGDAELASADGDPTIVNPGRLPRERAEAVCHQCHLTGLVQAAVRGRRPAEFRPGLLWQDFAIDYGYETPAGDMTVVGHVAQLRQSRCYQASQTLTCITCHDPHAAPDPAELIAHHRTTCLNCHAEPSCGVALAERTSRNGNNCAACHMPQSPTDVPHIAFTHHRIGIHQPQAVAPESGHDGFRSLEPLLDVSRLPEIDRRRALGLAYLQYYRDHEDDPDAAAYLAEARRLVEGTVAAGLIDAPLAAAQAELAAVAGDLDSTEHWARKTLALDVSAKERASALRWLAGIALQQHRAAEAEKHLEELTVLRRDPRDWFLLGVCRQRRDDLAGAAAAFERVLEIDPSEPETYQILASLHRAQGDVQRQRQTQEQARRLREGSTSGR